MPKIQTQPQYTQDQLWKLYDKLPPELQEAVFSAENAEHLDAICQRYEVAVKQIPDIAKLIGRVFLGVLPPEDFPTVLEKETELKKETAKQVTHEINRFIFAPVQASLAQIYNIGVSTAEGADASGSKTPTTKGAETPKATEEAKPAPKEGLAADTYRETVE